MRGTSGLPCPGVQVFFLLFRCFFLLSSRSFSANVGAERTLNLNLWIEKLSSWFKPGLYKVFCYCLLLLGTFHIEGHLPGIWVCAAMFFILVYYYTNRLTHHLIKASVKCCQGPTRLVTVHHSLSDILVG